MSDNSCNLYAAQRHRGEPGSIHANVNIDFAWDFISVIISNDGLQTSSRVALSLSNTSSYIKIFMCVAAAFPYKFNWAFA